jgi:hypothetical protein
MPIRTEDIIWALWEALEYATCLGIWKSGETAMVACKKTVVFPDNEPLVIINPVEFLEEYASIDHALVDAELHEVLALVISNAGGNPVRSIF